MATKKNSVPSRIDNELREVLEELKIKNDITIRQASKIVAKEIKLLKLKKQEIKF